MKKRSEQRHGFSLLELLVVIGIMAMLSTLAISSYFASVRAMSIRAAKSSLANVLAFARQRAVIDGVPVYVFTYNRRLSQEAAIGECVVVRQRGRISAVKGQYLFDEFSDLDQTYAVKTSDTQSSDTSLENQWGDGANTGSRRLYNLDDGNWTDVKQHVLDMASLRSMEPLLYDSMRAGGGRDTAVLKDISACCFEKASSQSSGSKAGTWKIGTPYGMEIAVNQMPKRHMIGSNVPGTIGAISTPTVTWFSPNGTQNGVSQFEITTFRNGRAISYPSKVVVKESDVEE